jgi:magnesium-transporting ATPase (P-type)
VKVHEALSPSNVVTGFSAPPGQALEALIELARQRGAAGASAAEFREEELHLIHGLKEGGVGLFHNLSERVEAPLLLLAVSGEGVRLAEGEPPLHVLVLLLSPIRESGTHLQAISKLISLLHSRQLKDDLLAADSPEAVVRAVRREEEAGPENYWVLSREEVCQELGTTEGGLSGEEAEGRLADTGPNTIERQKRVSLPRRFAANLVNLFALLLWAATGLAYVAGLPELALAIPVVIVVNAVFSFLQEYRAERAVEALEKLLPPRARVVRGGQLRDIEATGLVPGDVVFLEAGDQISADARLIEARDFRVDNSVLTGESRPAYKFDEPVENGTRFLWTEMPNLVFAGTAALSGQARGVVIATGMNTQLGHIAALTQAVPEEPSPLQRQVRSMTRFVAAAAFAIGSVFFIIGVATGKLTFAASLIFAIGLLVAFVPEGLLPTLSLSLAIGVQRMAAKQALVKRLSSVETLGAATIICTDKTGTLTTNEVMVQRLWIEGGELAVTGAGYQPEGELLRGGNPVGAKEAASPLMDLICRCGALCSTTNLLPPEEGRPGPSGFADEASFAGQASRPWRVQGDPTEAALLVLSTKLGRDPASIRAEHPQRKLFPFESVRKRMATVNAAPDGKLACWVKGAPETVLARCTHLALPGGGRRPLTDQDRVLITGAYNDFASHGLRILALAWKETDNAELSQEEAESGLTLIGVMGMIDPPRPEVPGAIERCHRAGIRVLMITGDYGPTARAIAAQIGLRLDRRFRVVTSDVLATLSDIRLKALLKHGEAVFARSSPEDKLRIVRALREMGEVVAVTGDGVNDAPALKQADIGVAMGVRGTEVSREAAAMVLADDNFASIVAAVEEGRSVYANIKKFITYIFASNVPEAVPFVLFVLLGIPLPLQVMQILAIDLGTDLLPALALGAEPPEPGTMARPPRNPKARLIDFTLLWRSTFTGILLTCAAMSAYYFAYWSAGWRPGLPMAAEGPVYAHATTMCWAGIVAAQAGNALARRTERESIFTVGLFTNRLIWVGLASMVVVVFLLSYVPVLQRLFGTAPLSATDLAFLLIFPPLVLAAEELLKLWLRRGLPRPGGVRRPGRK